MKRRKMMHTTLLAIRGMCACLPGSGKDTVKSNCCFTPQIEHESLSISEDQITIDLQKSFTIQERGYAALIIDSQQNLDMILVHDLDGHFHCLERFCTHGGRALSFIKERNLLQCNNYNHSTFELDGDVYNGPAPAALKSYPLDRLGDVLTIQLS